MIPKIKKILYATDLSKNSSYAFLYAIDMAKRHDAKIIILHAVEPLPPYAFGVYSPFGVITLLPSSETRFSQRA
jgi:nucleotide-binding universal stress UspA family protein